MIAFSQWCEQNCSPAGCDVASLSCPRDLMFAILNNRRNASATRRPQKSGSPIANPEKYRGMAIDLVGAQHLRYRGTQSEMECPLIRIIPTDMM